MKCKHCNVEIYGNADFCPLCKQPLEKDSESKKDNYVYPIKQKRQKSYKILTFTPMYFIVASVVFLLVVLINMLVLPNYHWFWLVGVTLLYVYILVGNTILSRNSIAHKILWQALFLFAFLWVLGALLYQTDVIEVVWFYLLDIALPSIIGLSNFVMCVVTACLVKKDKGLIVDCGWFSLTGFLPIILYWSGIIQYNILSIIVASLSLVQLVLMSILSRVYSKNLIKYKYRA